VRFNATDETLRPMGRATSGVTGMKFRDGDQLLSMSVVRSGEDPDVFVVFENGLAKRTAASAYPVKGRATLGVRVAQISERGGDLVGALAVDEDDEVMVVMEKGKIVRSRVDEVHRTSRNTMGVQFAKPDKGDAIVAVARNAEKVGEAEVEELVAYRPRWTSPPCLSWSTTPTSPPMARRGTTCPTVHRVRTPRRVT
jgi:DNA gyrase subunit A